jgi:hypothetical protein
MVRFGPPGTADRPCASGRAPPLEFPHDEEPDFPDEADTPAPITGLSLGRAAAAVLAFGIVLVVLIAIVRSGPATASTGTPVSPPPNGPVVVSRVAVYSPDVAGGLNGMNQGGFTTRAHSGYPKIWWFPGPTGSTPCSVESVTTNSTGFTLSSTLPMTVTSAGTPIFVTVNTPAAFNGTLYLTFE